MSFIAIKFMENSCSDDLGLGKIEKKIEFLHESGVAFKLAILFWYRISEVARFPFSVLVKNMHFCSIWDPPHANASFTA